MKSEILSINANFLISKSLNSLDDFVLFESLSGASSAIIDFCKTIKRNSFNSYLKNYFGELNGWALTDAIWSEICLRCPQLNFYPLGNITERAIRKTIFKLCFDKVSNLNIKEKQILSILRKKIKSLGIEEILKLFLCEYFFEICIDQNRRHWKELKFDLGFRYNFTKNGKFVSLDEEKKFRNVLRKICKDKAEKFFNSLKDYNKGFTKQKIAEGFKEIFGIEIKKRKKLGNKKIPINVVVGNISLSNLRKTFFVSKDVKRFSLHKKNSNVKFSFEILEDFFGKDMHSLLKDLLDIGVVIYMADLYVKREDNLKRNINIIMPVRHFSIWNKHKEKVKELVSFLGRDNFDIRFVKSKEKADKIKNFNIKKSRRCVSLFSGGLDTLSGAVWALRKNFEPILVSHYSSNLLFGNQKFLIEQLEKKFKKEIKHLNVMVGKTNENTKKPLGPACKSIMIQYLRSFLFLCLASAVALELKIKNIYVFENGPVTLNPMFSEARINTKTTHPHFINGFRELIKSVFGTELVIESPFLYKTKGEVVDNLVKGNLGDLAKKTISCWNWSRVPIIAKRKGLKKFNGRHDGICVPCIIRRVSMNHAHIFKKDARYLINVFTQFKNLSRQDKTMIADFLRFCKLVNVLPNNKILYRFPDLSLYEKDVDTKKIVGMYKRHANEVLDCFRLRSNKDFKKLFSAVLK